MDRFIVVKSINPGFIPPTPTPSTKIDEDKKDEAMVIKDDSVNKKDGTDDKSIKKDAISTPKKKRAPKSKTTTTDTTTTTTIIKDSSSSTISDTTGEVKKGPQQTMISHFFSSNTDSSIPSYKYLFEKEAADRAELERKRAERIAKEEAIAAEKRKQIQKAKLEAKKKREAARKKKEEEEWEEYLAMQEKTTKGTEIIPHLYLGSFLAAKNSEWLQEANITKIVNVTSEVPSYFLSKKDKENDKVLEEKDNFIVDDDEEDEEEDDDEDDEEDEDEEDDDEINIEDKDEEMKDIEDTTTSASTIMNKVVEMKDAEETITASTSTITDKVDEIVEMKDVEETTISTSTSTIMDKVNEKVNEIVDEEKVKELQEIKYLRIAISDCSRSKIENYFEEAIKFINEGNSEGNKSNVLIHCKQGRSRSPSIVIAYLMSNEKWTLEKSFNHISSVSPKNLTVNDGFKKKLMDFEMKLFNTNSLNFFDRSGRSSRVAINSTSITPSRSTRSSNKKVVVDDDDDDDDDFIIDTTTTALSTANLDIEDDAGTIDQLKVVKRRKNIVLEDDADE